MDMLNYSYIQNKYENCAYSVSELNASQVAERVIEEQQFTPDHLIQGHNKEILNSTMVDNKS